MLASQNRELPLVESRSASSGLPLIGKEYERMGGKHFQTPVPKRVGRSWEIRARLPEFNAAHNSIEWVQRRVKLGPSTTSEKEAQRLAAEFMRPYNQGTESVGGAVPFRAYVEGDYKEAVLARYASTVRSAYTYHLKKYLLPTFGDSTLGDMKTVTLQKYFNGLKVNRPTILKLKDVLASVLGSAVRYQLLLRNPLDGVQLPAPKAGKRQKPYITPQQFAALLELVQEPYATMVYVCLFGGLRVSELVGLRWEDCHDGHLTIDERFSRGNWGCPKTVGSAARVGVDRRITDRIQALRQLYVTIAWGGKGAQKTIKLVRSDGPRDLIFQSVRGGKEMNDSNILRRHIKPAGRKIGCEFVNWQVLRRSYGTWMVQAGADPKAVQAQMRHSRISTTMDIYAQFVPESQQRAVAQMMEMVDSKSDGRVQ